MIQIVLHKYSSKKKNVIFSCCIVEGEPCLAQGAIFGFRNERIEKDGFRAFLFSQSWMFNLKEGMHICLYRDMASIPLNCENGR